MLEKTAEKKTIILDGKHYPLETEQDLTKAAARLSQSETISGFSGSIDDLMKLADAARKISPEFIRLQDRIQDLADCSAKEAESLALYAQNSGKEACEAASLLDNPDINVKFKIRNQICETVDEVVDYLNDLTEAGKKAAAKTIKAVITMDDEETDAVDLSALVNITAPQAQQTAPVADDNSTIADATHGTVSTQSMLSFLTEQDVKDAVGAGKKGTTVCLFAPQAASVLVSKKMAAQLIQGQHSITGGVKAARDSMQEVTLLQDEYSGKLLVRLRQKQEKKGNT